MITWKDVSPNDLQVLRDIVAHKDFVMTDLQWSRIGRGNLVKNGTPKGGRVYYELTDAGRAVLAQAPAADATGAAGEMCEVDGLTMGIREDGSRTFYRKGRGYHEVFYDTLDEIKPLQAELTRLRSDLAAAREINRSLFIQMKQVSKLYSAYREYLTTTGEDVESVPFKTYIEKHVTENTIHQLFELCDFNYKLLKDKQP